MAGVRADLKSEAQCRFQRKFENARVKKTTIEDVVTKVVRVRSAESVRGGMRTESQILTL